MVQTTPYSIHVFWSAPKKRYDLILQDYEIFLMCLSALTYKALNKSICKLFVDTPTKNQIKKHDLLWVWDEIDTDLLDTFSANSKFPPETFMTAGKCYAISMLEPPFVFLDHDLVLFEKIPDGVFAFDVAYAHDESRILLSQAYPDISMFAQESNFNFNESLNWYPDKIPNSSIFYLNNKAFQDLYRREIDQFFSADVPLLKEGDKRVGYINLPDQRLLGAIMYAGSYRICNLMNSIFTNSGNRLETYLEKSDFQLHEIFHAWFLKFKMSKSEKVVAIILVELYLKAKSIVPNDRLQRFIQSPCFSKFFKDLKI